MAKNPFRDTVNDELVHIAAKTGPVEGKEVIEQYKNGQVLHAAGRVDHFSDRQNHGQGNEGRH